MTILSNLSLSKDQIFMASLPSDLPDSFFCSPPATKTAIEDFAVSDLAAQAGGILLFRRHALALQIKKPQGFWVSGSGCFLGLEFTRRVQALRSAS